MKNIPTSLTTSRQLRLTKLLVGAGLTLTLVSSAFLNGQSPDFVRTAYQTPRLMDTFCESFVEKSDKLVQPPPVSSKLAYPYEDYEVDMLAQMVWGEARGCDPEEQKLTVWCALNRARDWDLSIEEVLTAKNQFAGYSEAHPIDPEIRELCQEVVEAWAAGGVALVLPPYANSSDYYWFRGDGEHNWFREVY